MFGVGEFCSSSVTGVSWELDSFRSGSDFPLRDCRARGDRSRSTAAANPALTTTIATLMILARAVAQNSNLLGLRVTTCLASGVWYLVWMVVDDCSGIGGDSKDSTLTEELWCALWTVVSDCSGIGGDSCGCAALHIIGV